MEGSNPTAVKACTLNVTIDTSKWMEGWGEAVGYKYSTGGPCRSLERHQEGTATRQDVAGMGEWMIRLHLVQYVPKGCSTEIQLCIT